ncbi:hypothetical protein [Hymenobacter sp. BRD67]|uniref:hypothetical protein n=1 Tax=Hymenobacter sp. BRD67 TaxID=2675877 RepID=UPI00156742EF|nr:hypothetical protein [Hymenobacter sp. BRD67]QKG54553.1 hypothetical protein GKZ67_20590 [Hymenobacter sp. BRD67]
MLRRTLTALARTALLPVRGATLLYQAGRAHQHFFQPVLNGALGDQLAARHDPRAIVMSFRRGGHDVPVAELGLSERNQQTLVFVHGLMGDELIWQTGFQDEAGGPLRYGPAWPPKPTAGRSTCATTRACTSPKTAVPLAGCLPSWSKPTRSRGRTGAGGPQHGRAYHSLGRLLWQ